MKKFVYFIFYLLIYCSCKSQQIYPLITNIDEIPNGAYIKDIDHEYDSFVGTWKSNVNNKVITLNITKINQKNLQLLGKVYYSDVLIIKYSIVNFAGNIIENNINSNINDYNIISLLFSKSHNLARFHYKGTFCGVGEGMITLKTQDSLHLIWNYEPNSTILTNLDCPNYPSAGIKINLPYEPDNIVFTKQ